MNGVDRLQRAVAYAILPLYVAAYDVHSFRAALRVDRVISHLVETGTFAAVDAAVPWYLGLAAAPGFLYSAWVDERRGSGRVNFWVTASLAIAIGSGTMGALIIYSGAVPSTACLLVAGSAAWLLARWHGEVGPPVLGPVAAALVRLALLAGPPLLALASVGLLVGMLPLVWVTTALSAPGYLFAATSWRRAPATPGPVRWVVRASLFVAVLWLCLGVLLALLTGWSEVAVITLAAVDAAVLVHRHFEGRSGRLGPPFESADPTVAAQG